jgi:DNA-directed RNA polymerase I, II, and III subunit RPABC1
MNKSIQTICELLQDRKFIPPKLVPGDPLPASIVATKLLKSGKTKSIRVKWLGDAKFNKDTIQKIIDDMEREGVYHVIAIVSEPISTQSLAMLKSLRPQEMHIEVFEFERTLFNPTKHKLVPRHILYPSSVVDTVCADWGCTSAQLPRIHATDPIARWYGAQPGQIFKILRPSEVLGGREIITYRVVVT